MASPRYALHQSYSARLRPWQVYDKEEMRVVSSHDLRSGAARKVDRLNAQIDKLSLARGALATIVAEPDCCAASKDIAGHALRKIASINADNNSPAGESA